jgi:two-component system, NtrC family, response regulator AtoC
VAERPSGRTPSGADDSSAAHPLVWSFDKSEPMRRVGALIDQVAVTDATILAWGESGVGKELVAQTIHARSPRADRPFLKVNCAALPLELLESELFGYERGAFTGAHRAKPGKFELAHTGTILLDEIGEMPLPLQAKLLQVLQDGQFGRLGSRRDIRVDVRVIAATNRDLRRLVAQGSFRTDLYYRLNVFSLLVPPLRERREEIPALVEHFLTVYAERYDRSRRVLSPATLRRLVEYRWPGNVRQLENLVKRIVVLGDESQVLEDLDEAVEPVDGAAPAAPTVAVATTPSPIARDATDVALREVARQAAHAAERLALERVLDSVRWNRREASRRLKVNYKTLLQKIRQHDLDNGPRRRAS